MTCPSHSLTDSLLETAASLSYYWGDEDILTINLIASYFNFVNRIALGLGVTFTSDEVEGYKYEEASAVMPTAQAGVYGAQLASES